MIVLKPSVHRTGKNNQHEIAALLRRGKQGGFNGFRLGIFPLSSLKAVMRAQLRARIVEVFKVNFEKYRIVRLWNVTKRLIFEISVENYPSNTMI